MKNETAQRVLYGLAGLVVGATIWVAVEAASVVLTRAFLELHRCNNSQVVEVDAGEFE